jgi:tetratricopeptide (TPR) repeat protein
LASAVKNDTGLAAPKGCLIDRLAAQILEKCDGGHILITIAAAKMSGFVSSRNVCAASAIGDSDVESKCLKTGLPVVLRAILAPGLMVAVLTAAASAGPFEDAAAAYRQGDYTRALRIIRPMARKGYAPAQFKLGLIYVRGNGVPQDYREALRWYRKAADQDNAAAQRNLGVMFGEGRGVPQDYAEALKWFRRAAEQNDAARRAGCG